MASHFKCAELDPARTQVEKAIESGTTIACPHCGLPGGVKDNGCTHITCPGCRGQWCYMCLAKRQDADGASDVSFMGHNARWKSNPKRCPLYLESVKVSLPDQNPEWSDDSEEVVAYLIRRRTLCNLRKAYDAIG